MWHMGIPFILAVNSFNLYVICVLLVCYFTSEGHPTSYRGLEMSLQTQ